MIISSVLRKFTCVSGAMRIKKAAHNARICVDNAM